MNNNELKREIERLKHEIRHKKAIGYKHSAESLKELIAPVYESVHNDIQAGNYQYFNLAGGRGSGKSSFISLEIVSGIMQDATGTSNAIVFRRTATTMRESVFSQIAWAIDALEVNHLWRGNVSPMQYIYLPTGAQIIFRGLDDNSKLKSIKPKKGTFAYVWFEEFAELQGEKFTRNVMQSVVRGGNDFRVFRSFNPPISKSNWANQFILQADPKALTLVTNYTQIPAEWLGEACIYEAERLKEINPRAYQHEYLGEAIGSGGEVFPNIDVREITAEELENLSYIYCGLDWGFSVDPYAFIRLAYDKRTDTIYLLNEIYKKHCSNKEIAENIKAGGFDYTGQLIQGISFAEYREKQIIIADAAEPKSIADLRNEDLKVIACKKYAGSVLYGIKWLQHRRIIIDPKRTPNALREFTQYEYVTTKDGEFLADVPDKDNHLIDATRYALDRLINIKGISA